MGCGGGDGVNNLYYVETGGLIDIDRAKEIKRMIEKKFGNYVEIKNEDGEIVDEEGQMVE